MNPNPFRIARRAIHPALLSVHAKPYEYYIAWRYLRAKPYQTVMSTSGVVLGIAVVIVSLSIFSGFQSTLRDKLMGSEAHLIVGAHGATTEEYESLIDELLEMPQVVAATPTIISDILLQSRKNTRLRRGAQLRGIDPARAPDVNRLTEFLTSRELDFEREEYIADGLAKLPEGDTVRGGIILGGELARRLQVSVRDPVIVYSDFKEGPQGRIIPVVRNFVVVDTYRSGLDDIDLYLAFVSLDTAQELFDMEGVTQLEVRTLDPDDADAVQTAILDRHGLTYLPRTWKELRGSFFGAMELEKRLTFVILGLIVVVAGFSISIALIMLVMEKVREIGVLRAMGCPRGAIARVFMLNGTIVGFIGAALGTLISLGLCWLLEYYLQIDLPGDVYQIDRVPVEISWRFVLVVNVLSILICWLATIYPALRAARFQPVEALRFE